VNSVLLDRGLGLHNLYSDKRVGKSKIEKFGCVDMSKMRVGVIGCGWVSNGHIESWRKTKADIVSVCDVNEKAARMMAEKWKIEKSYTDFVELLEKSNLDVVDICTPPSTHKSFMVSAMEHGVNPICEKPMTMTVKEAQEIVDAKNKTGLVAGVVHNWLFEPTIRRAVSLVESGALGELINVEVEALDTKFDSMIANRDHWCHKLVGGRLAEMLPHPIYLVRKFLGPKISLESLHVSKVGDYEWVNSDELCATYRVGDAFGRVYASFNSPRDAIFVNLYGKKAYLKTDIINSTMVLYNERENKRWSKGFDSLKQAGQITSSTVDSVVKITTGSWDSGVASIVKAYADAVKKGGEPPVSVDEGLEVIKILEKMTSAIDNAEKEKHV
jgi:predicted dehydrogenase